jgi:hypothetical protein
MTKNETKSCGRDLFTHVLTLHQDQVRKTVHHTFDIPYSCVSSLFGARECGRMRHVGWAGPSIEKFNADWSLLTMLCCYRYAVRTGQSLFSALVSSPDALVPPTIPKRRTRGSSWRPRVIVMWGVERHRTLLFDG